MKMFPVMGVRKQAAEYLKSFAREPTVVKFDIYTTAINYTWLEYQQLSSFLSSFSSRDVFNRELDTF